MSKSLGNTISPGEMVEKFGADTVRLFILFGANPEAGMDWSDSALEANNRQLNQIVEAFRNAPSIESHQSGMDDWLLGRLSESRTRWVEAMNNVLSLIHI